MNRGDRREPIFQDDDDRRRFFQTPGGPFSRANQVNRLGLTLDRRRAMVPSAMEGKNSNLFTEVEILMAVVLILILASVLIFSRV